MILLLPLPPQPIMSHNSPSSSSFTLLHSSIWRSLVLHHAFCIFPLGSVVRLSTPFVHNRECRRLTPNGVETFVSFLVSFRFNIRFFCLEGNSSLSLRDIVHSLCLQFAWGLSLLRFLSSVTPETPLLSNSLLQRAKTKKHTNAL